MLQGLYSLSGRTSYGKISRSLEAARFGFKLLPSLWNSTGTSAAPLPRCLLNFRAIRSLWHPISRLRDFARFGSKTSYRLVNRGPGHNGCCKKGSLSPYILYLCVPQSRYRSPSKYMIRWRSVDVIVTPMVPLESIYNRCWSIRNELKQRMIFLSQFQSAEELINIQDIYLVLQTWYMNYGRNGIVAELWQKLYGCINPFAKSNYQF